MQNFKFFPTLSQYRRFVYNEIFKTSDFKDNVFYRALIEWIIQHRAPIFFELSEDFEFSHFTQYFNFVLQRVGYYKNDYVQDMYYAHDFVHMLFPNPLRVGQLSFEEFCTILNYNEWVASNETETLTYHRISEMREHSLSYTILYDLLMASGNTKKPTPKLLLDLRKDILFGTNTTNLVATLEQQEGASEVLAYLRKFKENNKAWCRLWYDNFPRPENPHEAFPYEEDGAVAPLTDYENFLESFNPNGPSNTQEMYERNVIKNVRNLIHLTQSPIPLPTTMTECKEALDKMEGVIVMRDAAEHFHETYIKNKTVGTGGKATSVTT